MAEPPGPEGGRGEPPLGGDSPAWDRPLTEDDAPWQPVWSLGGRFAHPGHRPPPPGPERRPPMHRELSRSRWEGLGARVWHWGIVFGALVVLLLALRLAGGDAGAAVPAGWHAFAADGYAGAVPPNWRHVDAEELDYFVVESPTPPSAPAGGVGRRLVLGAPAVAHPAVRIGGCRPQADSRADAQRQWAAELRAGGATLSVTRLIEVEGLPYQLLEVRAPAGTTQRILPVGDDGCARELSLTPIDGVVDIEQFAAVLATLRFGTE